MNFQSQSKKSGDEFEALVLKDLKERGFTDIEPNMYIVGTGCEVDFIARNTEAIEYVEAKGGLEGDKKRPGAKRTDNVKKAIANGSLIKCYYPDMHYVVYFSAQPDPGSYSEEMLYTALRFSIIDEVRFLLPLPEKTVNDIVKEIVETNAN